MTWDVPVWKNYIHYYLARIGCISIKCKWNKTYHKHQTSLSYLLEIKNCTYLCSITYKM